MDRETRQHVIYGSVFAVSIILIVSFFTIQINGLRTQLNEGLSSLTAKLESSLSKEASLREQSDAKAAKDIEDLSKSLAQKESQISTLSGDLSSLRIESQQQFTSLEENIKSVKIENQDFSAIIDDVVQGVVGIRTDSKQGSGFIADSEGYIITNYHVIDGARAAAVLTHDGENHRVRLVDFNPDADIAVLKIDGSFASLGFTDSDEVEIGQKVIAVGSPGGLDFTVTQGIISAKRQNDGNSYIQIDVPINPGNSGGALVTIEGKVAGVNSLKLAGFEGVGFALASNQVQEIIEPMIAADKARVAQLP